MDKQAVARELLSIAKEFVPERYAKVYNVDGQNLSKSEMLNLAIGKQISFSNSGTPNYNAELKEKNRTILFEIGERDFNKLQVKDNTTKRSIEKKQQWEVKDLISKKLKSMSKSIDFNDWVKENDATVEEQIVYLKRLR